MTESTGRIPVVLGFSGDLSFSGYYTKRYNEELLDNRIKEFLNYNDFNFINYESPITLCRITKKGYLAHRSDPEALGFIKRNIKNPVLSFANNHMMDYGDIGVADTLDFTQNENLDVLGMGKTSTKARHGMVYGSDIKVGVFSFQYKDKGMATIKHGGPLHESSTKSIKLTIGELRQKCDYVVAIYHGGEEFLRCPMPYTRKFLKELLSWGVDIVVAHHPHTVQGYERVGKKYIFYSLGNFIFDTDYQRIQDFTDEGLLLRLTFGENEVSFDSLPITIDRESGCVKAGKESESFIELGKNYHRMWTVESVRTEIIKSRKDKLREETKAKRNELEEARKREIREILAENPELYKDEFFVMNKAQFDPKALSGEASSEEDDKSAVNAKNSTKKLSFRRKTINFIKKSYNIVIKQRKKNYINLTKKYGHVVSHILYSSDVKNQFGSTM